MGGLTLMMVAGRNRTPQPPGAINQLLDIAFGQLHAQGNGVFGAFVRDEIDFAAFTGFMRGVAAKLPGLYGRVYDSLTKRELLLYASRLAKLGLSL